MAASVLSRAPAMTYVPHRLHNDDRTWPETNCHVDLWIELLHARGLEPLAGLAFTLGLDYEGDQFTFYRFPHNDLRMLYGIEVQELNLWRPLEVHAAQQFEMGRVLLVEVDAFYLPDTAGTAYRYEHNKTTIGVASIDRARQELGYFHARGCYTLGGNDYCGLFRLGEFAADVGVLPPFAEVAKLEGVRRLDVRSLTERAAALARMHFIGAPSGNPIARFAEGLAADLEWLRTDPRASFHHYTFATVRRAGSCFALTAAFLQWLGANGARGVLEAAGAFDRLSTAAKTVQFKLARMSRLKTHADVTGDVAVMVAAWDEGMSRLSDHFARQVRAVTAPERSALPMLRDIISAAPDLCQTDCDLHQVVFAGNIVECLEFETTREFLEARVVTLLGPAGRDAVVVVRENNDAGVDRLMTNPRLCFVDSLGTDWRIYEVASVNVPAPRGRNCLIFESAQAVRRVWNYPANWHNLSSDELSALSWNT